MRRSNVFAFGQILASAMAAPPVLDKRGAIYYALQDIYQGETFFDMFNFETEDDPTGGFVEYVYCA
jgi:hypothetical protein